MVFQQATRSLNITTPLGEDAVQLTRFTGEEELSRLFQFNLRLISTNSNIQAEQIVGKNITFSLDYDDGQRRYFNGFVQRFAAGDEDDKGRRSYQAVVVPWLWFLSQTTDCRIFQEKTIVEIIEQVFTDLGFTDYDFSQVQGTHPQREYCVQYRESDLAFVSRLLEEEGVFFFFKHEDGKHTLMMGDSSSAYSDCKESSVDYPRDESESRGMVAHIHAWEHAYEFRTGAWAHTDYNFKTPKTKLMTNEKTMMSFQDVKKYEQYDYPGEYEDKGVGSPLARVRMEELELEHNTVVATSGCKSFSPGQRFTVKRHRVQAESGKSYVIKKIIHESRESNYETDSERSAQGYEYRNRFECFPDSTTFRPARITRKPVVAGCQTAVVTGPPGEEIYPDEFGRVKVQFHWDREGKYDDKSSCWIRVSQHHAGKSFGYIDLPRIGEEVIVDFLEGDADRPIIVGRVYNAENKPPFDLPAGKTVRGNTTKTYKGSGYNEYVMDDATDNELIREHGQKDKDSTIENDLREHVFHDRSRDVTNNETIEVGVDRKKTVGQNEELHVGKNRTRTVGENEQVTVGQNRNHKIGENEDIKVGQVQKIDVGTNQIIKIGENQSLTIGEDRTTKIGNNDALSVAKVLTINAGDEIIIQTGSSVISMRSDGTIDISGKDITINGSGQITGTAKKDMVLKGKKILQN
ncbi:MAG: type VI secretion system tip protein TssI/VgrG [Pirellulaceae bacterium]